MELNIERVYLIAHSMGAKALSLDLKKRSTKPNINYMLLHLTSRFAIHRGLMPVTQAGYAGKYLCLIAGVDTIDASEVSTDYLGHGYFTETKSLVDDIFMIIANKLPPGKRNLKEYSLGKFKYWAFSTI